MLFFVHGGSEWRDSAGWTEWKETLDQYPKMLERELAVVAGATVYNAEEIVWEGRGILNDGDETV